MRPGHVFWFFGLSGAGKTTLATGLTEALRSLVREIVGQEHLDLVWVDAPLAVCQQRDPKGLYQRSAAGTLPLLTGVNSVFEAPTAHDLRVPTDLRSVGDLLIELGKYCRDRLD